MEDTISSVFLAGRDRCARLRQIASLVLCGALVLHLTLFLGYTRTVHDAAAARAALPVLDAAGRATAKVQESVGKFESTLDTRPILDRLLAGLKADFADLGEGIRELRSAAPASATREARSPNEMVQRPPLAVSDARRRIGELPPADRARIAASPGDLRATLDPIIEASIVKKRFDEANADWQRNVTVFVTPAAKEVGTAIDAASPAGAPDGARWDLLRTSVKKAREEAARVAFSPPPGNRWWQSVSAKSDAIDAISHQAADSMVDATRTASLTADLADDAQQATRDATTLVGELDAHRKDLEDQAKGAIASLASFAKPLEFVAVDTASLVRWFPLVVAMALALALYLGTEARRSYFDALDFVQSAAPDDAAWTRVVAQARTSLARGASPWVTWLAASALWIGAASWRLAALQISSVPRAVTVGAAGVALVAAGVAHRVFQAGRR